MGRKWANIWPGPINLYTDIKKRRMSQSKLINKNNLKKDRQKMPKKE